MLSATTVRNLCSDLVEGLELGNEPVDLANLSEKEIAHLAKDMLRAVSALVDSMAQTFDFGIAEARKPAKKRRQPAA